MCPIAIVKRRPTFLVTFNWAAVTSAQNYFIELGSQTGLTDVVNINTSSVGLTYHHWLPRGVYYARIRAVVDGTTGAHSEELVLGIP